MKSIAQKIQGILNLIEYAIQTPSIWNDNPNARAEMQATLEELVQGSSAGREGAIFIPLFENHWQEIISALGYKNNALGMLKEEATLLGVPGADVQAAHLQTTNNELVNIIFSKMTDFWNRKPDSIQADL